MKHFVSILTLLSILKYQGQIVRYNSRFELVYCNLISISGNQMSEDALKLYEVM